MTTALDINQFVYKTGTLTIAPGDTTAVFTGTMLNSGPVKDGDELRVGSTTSAIKSVISDTEVELFLPWDGDAVTNGGYLILKNSLLRYHTALAAIDTGELIAMINQNQIIYDVQGDVPDPSIGKENDLALKTNAGAWKLWKFLSGAWVLQATPVGVNYREQWDSGLDYAVNDQVSRLGSTYTALSPNSNTPPESNPSIWDLSAAKGDPGRDGGVIAIGYVFDGSATADTNPGDGKIRLGPGATQKAAIVWRASITDSDGKDWSGTLADLALGTSTAKCTARLYRKLDQAARLVGKVTAFTSPTGYRNLTFTATSGDDNPFTNGDELILALDPSGDKGNPPVIAGTSTSLVTVGTGSQSFTTQAGISWSVGQRIRLSNADSTFVMSGPITSYSGTSLVINVDFSSGTGSASAWNIAISGERGVTGPQGGIGPIGPQGQGVQPNATGTLTDRATHDGEAKGYVFLQTDVVPNVIFVKNSATTADWNAGSPIGGAGDMLKADNLSGLDDVPTARTNLGLGDLATKNQSDLVDPIGMAIVFGS